MILAGAFNAGEILGGLAAPESLPVGQHAEWRDFVDAELDSAPPDPLTSYFKGRRVWIIDDHASVWAPCLCRILGSECRVDAFETVDEAVRALDTARPDVIVLDLYVPLRRLSSRLSAYLKDRGAETESAESRPDPGHAQLALDLLTDQVGSVPVLVFTRSQEARLAQRALTDWGATALAFKNAVPSEELGRPALARLAFGELRDSLLLALRRGADWQLRLPLRRLERREPEVRDLRQWVDQFEAVDRPLAVAMATRLLRVDAGRLERMFDSAVRGLMTDVEWSLSSTSAGIVFVGAGRPGKSGPSMLYQLWHLPRLSGIKDRVRMVMLDDLRTATHKGGVVTVGAHNVARADLRLVLIDDFIGSGGTARGAASVAQKELRRLGVDQPEHRIALLAGCGTNKGVGSVGAEFSRIWIGEPNVPVLDDELRNASQQLMGRLRRSHGRIAEGDFEQLGGDGKLVRLRADPGADRLLPGDVVHATSARASKARIQSDVPGGYVAKLDVPSRPPAGRFRVEACITHDASAYEPLGFEATAALIAFDYNIPNNCPPVLWGTGKGWRPLFLRRA